MMLQTVTIYNRYGDDNPVRWGRQVLRGVHFKGGFGASTTTAGVSGGQVECLLLVPRDAAYRTPDLYREAEETSGIWTLQDGDLIFPGEGPEPGTGAIQRALPGCKRITGVTAHLYGSPLDHWEVTAR